MVPIEREMYTIFTEVIKWEGEVWGQNLKGCILITTSTTNEMELKLHGSDLNLVN